VIIKFDIDPAIAAEKVYDNNLRITTKKVKYYLSTAHRVLDGILYESYIPVGKIMPVRCYVLLDQRNYILYHAKYINQPEAKWCRKSVCNYTWMVDYLSSLINRHNSTSKDLEFFNLQSPPLNLKEWDLTKFPH
jgi:hypothetical protein